MASKRRFRVLRWTLGIIGGVIIAAVVGLVIWSQVGVMGAEPEPLAAVRADDRITITDDGAGIVLAPSDGQSTVGLVFIPGAKVEAWGYVATLAGLVAEDNITVVITKPWLNLAFFDLRPLSSFTDLAPEMDAWMVGGHSLGGVRACQLAEETDALVLFASYCSNDLSESGLPVLSLSGSEDGLSTPAKVDAARDQLPADADMIQIPGANHAAFGSYGPQAGDGEATASDESVDAAITAAIGELAQSLR